MLTSSKVSLFFSDVIIFSGAGALFTSSSPSLSCLSEALELEDAELFDFLEFGLSDLLDFESEDPDSLFSPSLDELLEDPLRSDNFDFSLLDLPEDTEDAPDLSEECSSSLEIFGSTFLLLWYGTDGELTCAPVGWRKLAALVFDYT